MSEVIAAPAPAPAPESSEPAVPAPAPAVPEVAKETPPVENVTPPAAPAAALPVIVVTPIEPSPDLMGPPEDPPVPLPEWRRLPYLQSCPVAEHLRPEDLQIDVTLRIRGRDFVVHELRDLRLVVACALDPEHRHIIWRTLGQNLNQYVDHTITRFWSFLDSVHGVTDKKRPTPTHREVEPEGELLLPPPAALPAPEPVTERLLEIPALPPVPKT